MVGARTQPVLTGLVDALGESANLAVSAPTPVMYVGQVPSRHTMRMFTEPGRRVHPHCTGVGKALLCQLPDDPVRDLRSPGMAAQTQNPITDPEALVADLARVRGGATRWTRGAGGRSPMRRRAGAGRAGHSRDLRVRSGPRG